MLSGGVLISRIPRSSESGGRLHIFSVVLGNETRFGSEMGKQNEPTFAAMKTNIYC